jgi:hypothetical protein
MPQRIRRCQRYNRKNYYDTLGYQLEKLDKFHSNLTFKQLDYNFLQKYAYYLASKDNKANTMKSDFDIPSKT